MVTHEVPHWFGVAARASRIRAVAEEAPSLPGQIRRSAFVVIRGRPGQGTNTAGLATTTQRSTHLSPAALDAAIRLLDLANGDPSLVGPSSRGGMLEAAGKPS